MLSIEGAVYRGMLHAPSYLRACRRRPAELAGLVALRRLAAGSLGLGEMRFSQKPELRVAGLAGSLGLAILLVHADGWLASGPVLCAIDRHVTL